MTGLIELTGTTGTYETADKPCRGQRLWRSPGLVDAHAHLAWTDFDAVDRARRTPRETVRLVAEQARLMRACGFTAMRDAGGMDGTALGNETDPTVTVVGCAAMIGSDEAASPSSLDRTFSRIASTSSTADPWVKLFLTGGMGTSPEHVFDPLMTRDRIHEIIARIHACGRRVMAHVWGGIALDWAIEAGVDTVEHGVYLTGEQAERLAVAHIPLIPTVAIYRILADRTQAGEGGLGVPAIISERASRAADVHPRAVRLARDAGVTIGVGTDYCTPYLFGRNLEELDALESCGLTRAETWRAVTETNARIIGLTRPAPEVIFRIDPMRAPHAADLRYSACSESFSIRKV